MKRFYTLLTALVAVNLQAQMTVDTNITALQMAQYLAGSGVLITNVQINCPNGAYGKFTGGNTTSLGINQGIALTSGTALELPNASAFASQSNNGISDPDLNAILATYPTASQSQDACILEFDVKVNGDSLNFNYVFGSEEYPNYTCSGFTDIFAFLISGPNPLGGNYNKQNIALIPGTNLPVSINTVNSGVATGGPASNCLSLAYSNYFVGNGSIVYDGHTTVFQAKIATVPCQTYHLKLAVADAQDQILDSGVMLEAYSFSAANIKITPGTNNNPLFVNAVEGCAPSGFILSIDNVLTDTFTINYAIGGTATPGVDYSAVSGVVVLPPGDTVRIVTIDPAQDFIAEGLETVKLYLLNSCDLSPYDSAVIYIQDSIVAAVTTPDDFLCRGEITQLFASGGLGFEWAPPVGLSATNVYNPYANPLATTKYYVTVSVGPCVDVDSIVITVTDPLFSVNAGPDDTLCLNEAATIPLQVNGSQQPYSYQWLPGTYLNDSTIQNPVTSPKATTNYEVIVTGANGCTQRDTVRYVIDGVGPVVLITPDNNFVCAGDTIQLNTQIFPLSCGLNTIGCEGQFAIQQVGNGNLQFANSPFGNFGNGQRMQILYRANELQTAGISSTTITDIAFDLISQGTFIPFDNFSVKVGCTGAEELNDWQTGLSQVFNGSYSLGGPGLTTITFDTPYDWDGYSNLVVEICYDVASFVNSDPVLSVNTPYNSVYYGSAFNEPGCNVSFGFGDFSRPNTRFITCTEPPKTYAFNWSPTTNLYTPDSLNPKVVLNQNTTYLLDVNDGQCSGTGYVDLKLANYGIFAGNDTVVCLPGSTQLNATITGNAPVQAVNCGTNNTVCDAPTQFTLTGTTEPFPFITPFDGAFNEDLRTQFLYRAADLQAMGLSAGTVKSIALNVTSKQSLQPFQNFNIKMACTPLQAFSFNLPDWPATQNVYSAALQTTTNGWNTFNLNTTFDWDGTTNLIVEMCWDNPDLLSPQGTDQIELVTTNYNSTLNATSTFDVGCDLPIFFSFTDFTLPRTRFNACPPPPLTPTFVWSPASGLSNPNVANPVANPSQTTTYVLTADFPGGCVKSDTITINPQQVDYTVSNDTLICDNGAAILTVVSNDSIVWQNIPGLSCYDCKTPTANPQANTAYYFNVITPGGCNVVDSVVVNVTTVDASVVYNDTLVDQGTAIQLFSDGSGGNGSFTFSWLPATNLDNATAQNPTATPIENTLYVVTVSSAGCSDTASVNVRVNVIESPIAMPNVFSPNGDGRNDLFYPVFSNDKLATVKEFRIYNRWGQVVHNSNLGWDGNFQSKEQPAGTYTYYIVIQRPYKQDEKIQGAFTLLK